MDLLYFTVRSTQIKLIFNGYSIFFFIKNNFLIFNFVSLFLYYLFIFFRILSRFGFINSLWYF